MLERESKPYENISRTNSSHYIQNAEKVIAEGWGRRNYPPINICAKIDWELKSENERSWNFHIHSLDMLDPLIKAFDISEDDKYLKIANKIVIEYIDQNITQKAKSKFVWYDMAVGLRVYRIAYLYDVNQNKELLNEVQKNIIWRCLESHCHFLDNEKNITFHTNHGYYQIAGQLAACRRFRDKIPEFEEFYRNGQERLLRILRFQFTSEGVHKEHSPDYHRMVYSTLKILIDEDLVDHDKISLKDFSNDIEVALSWFVMPDGYLANFGDTDHRNMSRRPATALKQWKTPSMQYLTSKGEIGELKSEGLMVYNQGGYFIVRKLLESNVRADKYSYLAQTAAFHSRTHKHADDLSIIWYDFGQAILVDAGRYGYVGKTKVNSQLWNEGFWYSDVNRMYCESTAAHNTLEFDEALYPRKGVTAYGSAIRRHLTDDLSKVYVMETECKHFISIRRARLLFYQPGNWLIVFDWFYDNLSKEHDVKQWFHLSPNLSLNEFDGTFATELMDTEKPLKITSLLGNISNSDTIIGQIEPTIQGWFSPSEKEMIPNFAFYFHQKGINGNFATLFSFTEDLEVDKIWSKVNVAGRKGQLKWKDDAGSHKIWFERPKEGDLLFKYDKK